ncbi:MAG: hypothetical protein WC059_00315 [Candidatus Paceibacterota bacterium]
MPSPLEELKSNPEHRSAKEQELKQSIESDSYHEDTLAKVRQLDISDELKKKDEIKFKTTKEELDKSFKKGTLVDENTLKRVFERIHLDEKDVEKVPELNNLNEEQAVLVAELASQDILANVKKLGQERFEKENKIDFSLNPKKWSPSVITKTWNKAWKSISISKSEKAVLRDVQHGQIKPDTEVIKRLVKKITDNDLKVIKKEGKSVIEFIEATNSSEKNKKIFDSYNAIANEFSRMPDAWRNEKAAKSTDRAFKTENHKKYNILKDRYAEATKSVVNAKTEEYKKQGLDEKEAAKKASIEMNRAGLKVSMLQFENTNPDAIAELDRIKNESSWGRLLWNKETSWRSIYVISGITARSVATTTLGAMTGPLVASIIGGARALRKANQKINTAFLEGRQMKSFVEMTSEERIKLRGGLTYDENGDIKKDEKGFVVLGSEGKGLLDNKNEKKGFLSKALDGKDVNTREVASFIDADSQINRLTNLKNKLESQEYLEKAKRTKRYEGDDGDLAIKEDLLFQIRNRIDYIDQKHKAGLINYGTKDPAGENYELLKLMGELELYTAPDLTIAPDGETEIEKVARLTLNKRIENHNNLLGKIVKEHEERFAEKRTDFATSEMLRGATIGATYSLIGLKIHDWFSEAPTVTQEIENTNEVTTPSDTPNTTTPATTPVTSEKTPPQWGSNKTENPAPAFEPIKTVGEIHKPIEVQLSSKGSIQTFLDLKEKLRLEYGKDLAHAPASVQHIMNTNATKLAEEFNMYNPTDVDESMMAPAGSKFIIDEKGNFSYQELGAKDATILEEGTSAKGTGEYKGKMFDYDKAKTLKVETAQNVGTSTPETPQTNTANIPSQTAETGAPTQGLHQNIDEIFPSDQEVRDGIARDHFRSLVNSHYENIQGEAWKNLPQADKNAEVWMGEKFGKVNVGQKADGTPTIGDFIEPSQNLGIDLKSVPVAEAIKTNATVASGIADLQKIARAQLGYDMVIDKNESTSSYIHRVFTALESASQEQPEAPALEEEINRMGRPGKILPGDYMADQSQEEYMGETSVNQTEVSASTSSEANPAGEDGGLGRAEKGPGNGKVYIETQEEPKNPIKWEKYRDHKIITADDVKGRNEVIGISPNTNDRGVTYRDWNRTFDNQIVDPEADNVKFGSYNQYETERELQLLFGKGEKVGNEVHMTYFRHQPEWKTVSKIPARYFYNEIFGMEYLSHYPREISDAQLKILKDAGLIREVNFADPTTGTVTQLKQFTHHAELARLAQAYRHINPDEAQPYPNETIEDYVGRLMKKVHQTQDGSFFARKHDINFDEAGQSMQQQAPTQQMPVYTPDNPGIISPTRGIYNTGGSSPSYGPSNYGPSYYGPQGNYNPQYGPQGFNTGSTRGDVIVGGVGVAQVALNEGVNAINGNTQTGGGKRILNSAVQTGVQIGVNGIMRQIFGNGGGYYGGGSNWQ